MKRSSGVLLNISSLPGDFGIGDFSSHAKDFAKNLLDMGFHWWQILPLNGVGIHNSPYDSHSAYAGNYLYIDPYGLIEDGLLTRDDIAPYIHAGQPYTVEYDNVKFNKKQILVRAFEKNADIIPGLIADFDRENSYWLDDYASYMVLKSYHSDLPWCEWGEDIKLKKQPYYGELLASLSKYMLYFKFEQYLFWKQWRGLKDYANSIGLKIIGDSPIYVSYDSVDVYHNPEYFQLDSDLKMKKVAGVPPDYFSDSGQLWNNPLYDYKAMKKSGYSWLKARIKRLLTVYDAVRIDHFRGFYEYYAIDGDGATAANGKWEKGPGIGFFREINREFKNAGIIAEDLGIVDDKVRKFLDKTGYPGMRVFEFGFDGGDGYHLPHSYVKNCVAYTGTHDNDTALGWLYSLNDSVREYALRYSRFPGGEWGKGGRDNISVKAIVKTLMSSVASLVILPIQDLCGFGSDTRMNIPGLAEGNWLFRLPPNYLELIDRGFFVEVNNVYARNNNLN